MKNRQEAGNRFVVEYMSVCVLKLKRGRERREDKKKAVSQKLFAQYDFHIVTQQGNVVPYGYKIKLFFHTLPFFLSLVDISRLSFSSFPLFYFIFSSKKEPFIFA